jgi:hypothetical protein
MIRVILESPYTGDIERNIEYARLCVKDSLLRGESPICSHLLYTQEGILDDDIPEERKLGIDAGLAWKGVAEKHIFYTDHGMSAGMEYGLAYAIKNGIHTEQRKILCDPIEFIISEQCNISGGRTDEHIAMRLLIDFSKYYNVNNVDNISFDDIDLFLQNGYELE